MALIKLILLIGAGVPVFLVPRIFIGSSHTNHDGCSPCQGKKTAQRNEKCKGFPAIQKSVWFKTYGCVATTRKENCINGIFHDAKSNDEKWPKENFNYVEQGQKHEGGVKMKENTVVLMIRKIFTSKAFKAHVDMVNGAAVKHQ